MPVPGGRPAAGFRLNRCPVDPDINRPWDDNNINALNNPDGNLLHARPAWRRDASLPGTQESAAFTIDIETRATRFQWSNKQMEVQANVGRDLWSQQTTKEHQFVRKGTLSGPQLGEF